MKKPTFITSFILVICLFITSWSTAQSCATLDPNNSVTYDSAWRAQSPAVTCGDLASFNTNTTLTFRVNFHFFRPTTGNPIYNGPKDYYKNVTVADCQNLITYLNARMSALDTPCLKATPPVANNFTDSKIRYWLSQDTGTLFGHPIYIPHVYFHTNDTAWKVGYSIYNSWAYNRYGTKKTSEINIFFLGDSTYLGVGWGPYSFINMSSFGWNPTQWCNTCTDQTFVGTLVHELGHSAGNLGHTNGASAYGGAITNTYWPSSSPTDYNIESGIYPCWGNVPSACQGGCGSNNIMGYNNDRHYLSPEQIGAFYYGVFSGKNTKFVVGYQDFNPCTYDSTKTINIANDTTWNNIVMARGDVVVQAGKTLTIRCTVTFSNGGRLIIQPTARVILDGGTLTSMCGFWRGVQVRGSITSGQLLTRTGMPVGQGLLVIQNGGAIMNAQVGATTIARFNNGNQDANSTGGMIQATQGNFIGNNKDVEFLWYQYSNSNSFFTNCTFSALNPPPGGTAAPRISMNGINNVRIYGSTFVANTSGSGAPLRDNGITATDAGFVVDSANATSLSLFKYFKYGINAQNSTLLNQPITVNATTFHVNLNGGIYISKANYATLTNNTLRVQYANATQTNPDYGIYMDQCTGYSIRKNTITGTTINNAWHVGICINASGTANNSVYNNNFNTRLKYALMAQEQNQNNSGATGLLMNCNVFTACSTNVSISGSSGSTGILKVQGSFSNPALYVRNQYNAPACGSQNLYAVTGVGYQLWHPSFTGTPYQPIPQQSCSDSTKIRLYQLSGTYSSSYCPDNCTGCRTVSEIEHSIKTKIATLAAARISGSDEEKQTAQDELNFENAQLGLASTERIRNFLNDTSLHNPLDSVIVELKTKRNPDYLQQLASFYTQKGDLQIAQDYMDSAKTNDPANVDMYEIGIAAIAARADQAGYIANIKSDAVLKNKLLAMANNPLSSGCAQAKGFLGLAFGSQFNEHWVFANENSQRAISSNESKHVMSVYPNPSNGTLNIEYTVLENENVKAIVSDVSGRTIQTVQLASKTSLHTLNVSSLNNGLYFLTLLKEDKPVQTTKIAIVK